MIRAFIAIDLPSQLRERLGDQIQHLKAKAPEGVIRLASPAGIHLTLRFLGDLRPSQIEQVGAVIQDAASSESPFRIEVSGLGCFPNAQRPRVIWAGVYGEVEPLLRLQRVLEDGLAKLGFEPEGRPFRPHLTLGRVRREVRDSRSRELAENLDRIAVGRLGEFVVQEISLFRSDLRPTGAVYSVLLSRPLGGIA